MKQHQHGVDVGGVAKPVSHRNAEGGTDSSSKDLQGYRSVRLITVSLHLPFETEYIGGSVHWTWSFIGIIYTSYRQQLS
jgi:hypothetical protein